MNAGDKPKTFERHAYFSGRRITVGVPCKMPNGEPGHHTREGRIADRLLRATP